MKKVIVIVLMLIPLLAVAQDAPEFILTSDGTYQTADGKDFVVVPFEGMTAHQIYQELATNIGSTYNNPTEVMSGVEGSSIKIRAYSDFLWLNKFLGIPHRWGGFYQIEFRIKDGRVRVSAPYVEDVSMDTLPLQKHAYGSLVKKWFKKGELKEGDKEKYDAVVAHMNNIIARILFTSDTIEAVDEW